MKLEYFFIISLAIVLSTGLLFQFYSGVLNNYGFENDYDQYEAEDIKDITFDYETVYSYQQDMKTSISSGSSDQTDAEQQMYQDMYQGARSKPFSASGLIGQGIFSLGGKFGDYIPSTVLHFLAAVIGTLVIFSVIYLVRGISQR